MNVWNISERLLVLVLTDGSVIVHSALLSELLTQVKLMNFALKMMNFVLKMMNCVLKLMNFASKTMKPALKMMNFVFKMMNSDAGAILN